MSPKFMIVVVVNEAWSYFDDLATLSRSYYQFDAVEEDLPPLPSVAFDTDIANDSVLLWVHCDSMPSASVEFDSSIDCDGDLLEMSDEVTVALPISAYSLTFFFTHFLVTCTTSLPLCGRVVALLDKPLLALHRCSVFSRC
ncbi:hypothetical protein Dimus_029493 [Dionaea muscipula]